MIAKPTKANFRDIEGQEFGRWKVESFAGSDNGARWLCRCRCGTVRVVAAANLFQGSQSCGCLQREAAEKTGKTLHTRRKKVPSAARTHGMSRTKEYRTWNQMIQRCHNPRNPTYERYGAKGVEVCRRWRESFAGFFADMGLAPSPSHTIDRIRSDRGYEPGNCRWLPASEQAKNRLFVKRYAVGGEMLTAQEIAARCGVKVATIKWRLNKGWGVEKAMTRDPKTYHGRA